MIEYWSVHQAGFSDLSMIKEKREELAKIFVRYDYSNNHIIREELTEIDRIQSDIRAIMVRIETAGKDTAES